MNFFNNHVILLIFFHCVASFNLYAGDDCKNTNENGNKNGNCAEITKCPWALRQIKRRLLVDTCSFEGKTPIICCPEEKSNEELVTRYGYGEISSEKCDEYYPRNVFFAYGGTPSLAQEFPHMAILGYGAENDIQWGCGGSLISLQHILTAAHCLASRELGAVKFVRLGDLDIKDTKDQAEPQDFTVAKATPHPDYDSRTSKNDIAVLELDREVERTSYVKPACLHIGNSWPDSWSITASGWGVTEFDGEMSSHLMKVFLKFVDNAECKKQYAKSGARANIDDDKQICADSADSTRNMDTCQGDSGGPLQVTNFTKEKHYSIIGVTSYGKACGLTKSAGVYTRVSYYVPWIESIVWNSF